MLIRKTVILEETVLTDEFGRSLDPIRGPITRAVGLAVLQNPFAGTFGEDLSDLFDIGARIGDSLMPRLTARLQAPAIGYGKGALIGTAGALEHGAALIHPRLGKPMRSAVGGGEALIPANAKVAPPGASLDIPLGHKDNAWSFDHIDTITVSLADAPRADEIVLCMAVTDGPRPHARVGKGPITD
ncbi:amino acid synthesis family protein [Roseibium sp.]|uniref:amino acid synthesis family protein n=1 Tax=Roseibium sp. TaxID=1936156 RepID=UPI003D10882C